MAYLQKPQASVDKDQADATASLIRALEGVPNGVCQIGSIVVAKITDQKRGPRIVACGLTSEELIHLERNSALLRDPEKILDMFTTTAEIKNLPQQASNR